jgi:hypothetical protein
MAKGKKQITAKCSPNRLERRWRSYAQPSTLEDIRAEHVTEDELVEIVKFAKSELLARLKKYNLESTKKNILKARSIFDLDKQEEQYRRALKIAIEQLEISIKVYRDSALNSEQKKAMIDSANTICKLLKEFLKEK